MRTAECKTSPFAFLETYRAAPDDADIEFRLGGLTADSDTHVICSINGEHFSFLPDHARKMADVFESTMRAFFGTKEAKGLENIILALRTAADRCSSASLPPDKGKLMKCDREHVGEAE